MKKYVLSCVVMVLLVSCDTAADNTKTNSSAMDSTQTPNGVSTGSVISTDTAATRMDTTQHK